MKLLWIMITFITLVHCFNFEWVNATFQTISCTNSTASTDCANLQTLWGMEVCCADVTVRNGTTSSSPIISSSNQCYPTYLATFMPQVTAGGFYVTYTCLHSLEEVYLQCTTEDDCDSNFCCMTGSLSIDGV